MKLGIISQWTTPDLSRIPADILGRHVERGGTAKVLTSYPNYPHGTYHSGSDGKLTNETHRGFLMRRVPSYVAKDGGAKERIKSFISFAVSSLRHSNYLNDVDVVYVYATPMTSAMAAIKLRLLKRIPYVLHVQDIWPESVTDSGMIRNRYLKSAINAIISVLLVPVYRLAAQVIVISPSAKPLLMSRGVKSSRITVIYNWHERPVSIDSEPTKSSLAREGTDEVSAKRPMHFVYAGNIGHMQDLENLVKAASLVPDDPSFRISVYGSGVQEASVRRLAEELKVNNIDFHGRVNRDKMRDIYNASDFQLVLLKDSRIFRANIPSKFQAAVANGCAIITTVPGDLADVCNRENLGISAVPEDPKALAAALERAASMSGSEIHAMRSNAQRFYDANLTPNHGISKMLDILENSYTIDSPKGLFR